MVYQRHRRLQEAFVLQGIRSETKVSLPFPTLPAIFYDPHERQSMEVVLSFQYPILL